MFLNSVTVLCDIITSDKCAVKLLTMLLDKHEGVRVELIVSDVHHEETDDTGT